MMPSTENTGEKRVFKVFYLLVVCAIGIMVVAAGSIDMMYPVADYGELRGFIREQVRVAQYVAVEKVDKAEKVRKLALEMTHSAKMIQQNQAPEFEYKAEDTSLWLKLTQHSDILVVQTSCERMRISFEGVITLKGGENCTELATIASDGTVKLVDGAESDAAAKAFWDSVNKLRSMYTICSAPAK